MKHQNIEECLQAKEHFPINQWHIAGCGETLERSYQCKICLRVWREVYTHAVTIDETNNRMIDSAGEKLELNFMEVL